MGNNTGTDSEQWCNDFAAALLLPTGPLLNVYARGQTVSEIALTFCVPTDLVRHRLFQLGATELFE